MKKVLFGLFIILGCQNKEGLKYQDFNDDDFTNVPGIVTKITRTPIVAPRWYEYNVFYAYNLTSDTVLIGKKMDANIVVNKGDGIYILVHKENPKISFIGQGRLVPNDEYIIQDYLKKSAENGVEFYGVD
jgi:hypothetical protein